MWYLFSHNKFFSVAIVCTIIATAVVIATCINIKKWSYEIQEKRSNTIQSQLLIDNYDKQLALYSGGFTEKIDALFTVRPTHENLVDFLDSMDEIANKSGVREFVMQNVAGGKNGDRTSYKIRFEATPKTLQKYLDEFMRLPFYLEITSLVFNRRVEQDLPGLGDATINFHIFINNE